MIKVDSIGQEFCLPCGDTVEGVIVEREGECMECNDVGDDTDIYTVKEGK